jgi:hypothetical protein
MASYRESYKGNYTVTFSCKADPRKDLKPLSSTFRRIDILGPPFILLCFKNKKDFNPERIIPCDQVISLCIEEEKGKERGRRGKAKKP